MYLKCIGFSKPCISICICILSRYIGQKSICIVSRYLIWQSMCILSRYRKKVSLPTTGSQLINIQFWLLGTRGVHWQCGDWLLRPPPPGTTVFDTEEKQLCPRVKQSSASLPGSWALLFPRQSCFSSMSKTVTLLGCAKKLNRLISPKIWNGTLRSSRGPESARKSQILVAEVQGGPNTFILLGFVKPQKNWISRQIWNGTLGSPGGSEAAQKCLFLVAGIQGKSMDTNIVGVCKKVLKNWISCQIWNGTLGPPGGSELAQKCQTLVPEVRGSP